MAMSSTIVMAIAAPIASSNNTHAIEAFARSSIATAGPAISEIEPMV
jgi:hypothetical protein